MGLIENLVNDRGGGGMGTVSGGENSRGLVHAALQLVFRNRSPTGYPLTRDLFTL